LLIGPANVAVGRGRTSKARWLLYTRRGRFGGFCIGLQARPPSGTGFAPRGEGCGGGPRREPLTLGLFYGRHRGTFAYGMAAPGVARVRTSFGEDEPLDARLLASPPVLGFAGRFWIASFPGQCAVFSAEAFDGQGRSLGRVEIPEPPPRRPGEPDPRPRRDCPGA
jgi:hypothetical protein